MTQLKDLDVVRSHSVTPVRELPGVILSLGYSKHDAAERGEAETAMNLLMPPWLAEEIGQALLQAAREAAPEPGPVH